MAGGGDSVAGVILLSFPQTGTGCRFEALVSVLQQAGSKKDQLFHLDSPITALRCRFMMLFVLFGFYRVERRQSQSLRAAEQLFAT